MELKDFLIERKGKLLVSEAIAKGKAKTALTSQLQVIDSILIFLSTKQTEDDMAKLKLSMDSAAISLDDLKPRARESKVIEAILEFVENLQPGQAKPIDAPGISKRTVLSTVYALKKQGRLPENIIPISRNNGKEAYIGKAKEEDTAKPKGK